MQKYILEIVGLIIFSILVFIILPNGEIKKYILGVMSLITLCVIISPLPNILSKGKDILDIENIDFSVDNDFLDSVNLSSDEKLKNDIENYLKNEGIECNVVIVKNSRNINETDYINVILKEVSLSDADKNIIVAKVKNEILEKYNLSCEVRVFYERQNET